MNRTILVLIAGCVSCLAPGNQPIDEPYIEIPIREVYSKLIVRDANDPVHSGQIHSEKGLAEFWRTYGLDLAPEDVDFGSQMLIFGITDDIATRAFRFLTSGRIYGFYLDYYDSGIEYMLKEIHEHKKYSYVQIFLAERIPNISNVQLKNLIRYKISRVYR